MVKSTLLSGEAETEELDFAELSLEVTWPFLEWIKGTSEAVDCFTLRFGDVICRNHPVIMRAFQSYQVVSLYGRAT